jgi:hypothetical protein
MSGVVAALRYNAEYDQAHSLASIHFPLGSGKMTTILYGTEWVHVTAMAALVALTLLRHRLVIRLAPARHRRRQTAPRV